MTNYIPPKQGERSFTCPTCGVLAGMEWDSKSVRKSSGVYYFNEPEYPGMYTVSVSTCKACANPHFWVNDNMVIPIVSGTPMPNQDMPEIVANIYQEAREVLPYSAKASAALLRLALQHLCKELGGDGKNINDDISKLVGQGLSVKIQRALDSIRVIGNNAVHPGTIDLDDNPDIASLLFQLLNIIVNEMITQPKQIDELYSKLPQGSLNAIEKRDNSK